MEGAAVMAAVAGAMEVALTVVAEPMDTIMEWPMDPGALVGNT